MILCPNKMKNLPEKMIFPGMIFVIVPVGRVFIPEKINFSPGKIVFPGRKMKIIGINGGMSGINRATIPDKIRKAPRKIKNIPEIRANLGTNRVIYPASAATRRMVSQFGIHTTDRMGAIALARTFIYQGMG